MAGSPTFALHISLTVSPKSVYLNLAELLLEMLKPFPQHSRAGFAIAPATHKTPEPGNPVDRLPQRGRLWRRGRCAMDGARERLPFLELQQDRAGGVGHNTAQHGGRENPPGHHARQGQ